MRDDRDLARRGRPGPLLVAVISDTGTLMPQAGTLGPRLSIIGVVESDQCDQWAAVCGLTDSDCERTGRPSEPGCPVRVRHSGYARVSGEQLAKLTGLLFAEPRRDIFEVIADARAVWTIADGDVGVLDDQLRRTGQQDERERKFLDYVLPR